MDAWLAGSASGVATAVAMAPIDVVRTRAQVEGMLGRDLRYSGSLRAAARAILATDGWRGLFHGVGTSVLLVPAFWGAFFPLRVLTEPHVAARLGADRPDASWRVVAASQAVASALAATAGDIFCFPLWTVRTRLQTRSLYAAAEPDYRGTWRTARAIVRAEGVRGLYGGLGASICSTLVHFAVHIPLYEAAKVALRDRGDGATRRERASAVEVVVASATTKLVASAASCPFDVVRSRMQDQRPGSARYASTLAALRTIAAAEGARGLYAGLWLNVARALPATAVTFSVYEAVLAELQRRR
jgi:hypothetical protein